MNKSLGYYKVGDEVFFNKSLAVYKANEQKKDVDWYFHDDILKSVDWLTEPEISLSTLYRTRAEQIRQSYDYVVVFASGGADSTNVIYSFLKNGIHIDEIIAGAPLSGLNNWKSSLVKSAENTISETFLTQLPLMKEVHQEYPKVKITVHDYFYDMLNFKTDQWLFDSGSYIHPTFAARYNLERYRHIRDIIESGKSVGLVYGIDKPFIVKKNNSYYSVIFDVHVCNGFQSIKISSATPILFYYSPDLPELLVKQAHETYRFLHQEQNNKLLKYLVYNEDYAHLYGTLEWESQTHSGIYERAIVPCIYPDLAKQSFQCNKPNRAFMGQHDDWLYRLHKDSKLAQMIDSDFLYYTKNIDKKYFTFLADGTIRGFKSNFKSFKIKK